MDTVAAYILAGGRSSRFGSDKARATLNGKPLILHVAEAMMPIVSRLTVVADTADRYVDLNLPMISDRVPGVGPLGGLDAALRDQLEQDGKGWVLLTACDVVEIRRHWIMQLLRRRRVDAQAVAFRDRRWQPLLALYHTSIADRVHRHIEGRILAMRQLLDSAKTVRVPQPDDWPHLWQINTPEQWREYRRTTVSSTQAG